MKTRTLRKWLCASALLMMTGAAASGCADLGDDDSLGAQNQNLRPGQGSLPGWDIGEPDPQQPGEAPSPDSSTTSCEDILRTIDPNADPVSQVGAREAFARCVEAQNPSSQAPDTDAAQVCDPILERLQYTMDPAEADQIIQAHADCLMSFDGADGSGQGCELVYAPDGTRQEVCSEPPDAAQVCDPILERLQYVSEPNEVDQIIRAHADCLSSFHGDDGSGQGCELVYNPDGSRQEVCGGAPDAAQVCDPILERLQYTMDPAEADQIIRAHADCMTSFAQPQPPTPDDAAQVCDPILERLQYTMDPVEADQIIRAHADCLSSFHGDDGSGCELVYNPDGSRQEVCPEPPDAAQLCDPILERLQYTMDPAEADQIIQAHADCLMSFDSADGSGQGCELVYAPDGTRQEVCTP